MEQGACLAKSPSALLQPIRGAWVEGLTIKELALLFILLDRIPKAKAKHVRTLLCILRNKNNYLSIEEIEKNTLILNGELKKIMQCFAKNNLVEKDGCLYKKPAEEKIAEIIAG